MVHFGRYLNGEQNRSNVNYKALKKLVKVCASGAGEYTVESVTTWSPNLDASEAIPIDGAARDNNKFLSQIQEEVQKLNEFVLQAKAEAVNHEDIQDLAIFAETNRVACHKIIKKFHKKCGQWDDLQFFLDHLHEEFFLSVIADELPQARITLQSRLSLAGVCPESPHEDMLVITSADDEDTSPSDMIRITMEDLDQTSTSTRSAYLRLQVRRFRGLFVARNLVPAALMCCATVLLGVAGVRRLGLLPSVSDAGANVLCGLGILFALMTVVAFLAAGCDQPQPEVIECRPPPRFCFWQHVKYAELFAAEFSPAFVVMKVWCNEKNTTRTSVAENATCLQAPRVLGADTASAHMLQTTCGCCLGEFEDHDGVTLLPCYHVFCDECILSWAMSSATGSHRCPMCRASFSTPQA